MRYLLGVLLMTSTMLASAGHAAVVLVTGADRGLGLEFVRQYAARGDRVIATCRTPAKASELQALAHGSSAIAIEKLDVNSDEDIKALAARYHGKPIDILINNAGIVGSKADNTLGSLDRQAFNDVMNTNVYGPMALSQALLPNVLASDAKKIIAVTSGVGFIRHLADLPEIPLYYSISKAALNLAMRALGTELAPRGVVVGLVGPGSVDTEMYAQAQTDYKFSFKPITKAESIHGMMAAIDVMDQAKAAQGVSSYNGTISAW